MVRSSASNTRRLCIYETHQQLALYPSTLNFTKHIKLNRLCAGLINITTCLIINVLSLLHLLLNYRIKISPVANLFFISDILYPGPASSNSAPDNVAPSAANCMAVVTGFVGPLPSSNLARMLPWDSCSLTSEMSLSFQLALLAAASLVTRKQMAD